MISDTDRIRPDDPAADATPASAFAEVAERLSEVKDYTAYFIAAKLDQLKLSVRHAAMYAVLGMLGLVAGATLAVMSIVMVFTGIAGAISALCGTGIWLGNLITGSLIVGLVVVGAYIGISRITKLSTKETVSAYERRKQTLRNKHGVDVQTRAEE